MMVPSQGCRDFIIDHHHGDKFLRFYCTLVSLVPRRCRSIAEMLTERAVLQDVAPNNRVLAGAKNLLLKYALCNLVRQVAQEERNPGCQTCLHSVLRTQTVSRKWL